MLATRWWYGNPIYKTGKSALRRAGLFEPIRVARNRVRSRWLVHKLSRGAPFKLEIGGGAHPMKGFVHLDARGDLPSTCIDVVHDIRRPLPFPEARVLQISTSHCIEHVSWRQLPGILRDWCRALVPGGRLVIKTPDLESITRGYLAKSLVHENNEEERLLTEQFGGMTQSWSAILKLFAGQDYPANFHYAAYDFETLKTLLLSAGFSRVDGPHAFESSAQDELQAIAWK